MPQSPVNGETLFPPAADLARKANVDSMEAYRAMYNRSLAEPDAFWREQALAQLDWFHPFGQVQWPGSSMAS